MNIVSLLFKYAQTEKVLAKLDQLGVTSNMVNYVVGLDPKLYGLALAEINKNKTISIDELKNKITQKLEIIKLKEQTAQNIEKDIPQIDNVNIKNWAVNQIKKYPNKKAILLQHLDKIIKVVNEQEINIFSYDIDSIIKYVNEYDKMGLSSNDESSNFINKALDHANNKLMTINNKSLIAWSKAHLLRIAKEWKRNIDKELTNKPFNHLVGEAKQMKEDLDNGLYRDKELPNTPLRNREFDALLANLDFLDDWISNTNIDLSKISVDAAIKHSNDWHHKVAESGTGLKFDPINKSNIVYGPNNWKDEKNNGFIILELKSENDLKVEGAKQNHCVGGYGEKIKNQECRIFSLRNVNDIYKPILTIETDMSGAIVRQDYGADNSKSDQKYHDMVSEWKGTNKVDMSKLSNEDKYQIINNNPSMEILRQLSEDSHMGIRHAVAEKENLDYNILLKLSQDPNHLVREKIAQKEPAPADILKKLSQDPNHLVRAAVAQNDTTPADILKKLSEDQDSYVKERVAQNDTTPADILKKLSEDQDDYIRAVVAQNKNTSPNSLSKLSEDQDQHVREWVAKNVNTPPNSLSKLSKDEYANIKLAVAKNKNTPPNALIELSKEKYLYIRIYVAQNKNTPIETLHILAQDSDEVVKDYAKETLEKLKKSKASILNNLTKKSRFNLFKRIIKAGPNYDLGQGLYDNMDKYKSVKQFLKRPHGPGAFTKDINNIDFKDDNIESNPIIPESGSSYLDSIPISYNENYTALPDQDGKTEADLDFGEDIDNDSQGHLDYVKELIDPKDLEKLESKYLDSSEQGLFGLPDGVDQEGHDADQTISIENSNVVKDNGRQMYEDKWNI
jgi:Asp-tRNA(Asn)/Glu-tRNA(Gln) amidotransferase C subunit